MTTDADSPCDVTVSSDLPDWDAFLASIARATVYHNPAWGQVMGSAYANEPYYLTARRGQRIVGTLQLVGQRSMLFGSHLCSTPYFDAAGILALDGQAEKALIDRAAGLMGEEGYSWVELRQAGRLDESLPARTDKVTLSLTIGPDSEATWNALKTKVRTKVRRTMKNDLDVVDGCDELLDEFHDVYSRTMRDLGSPGHSRRFFSLVLEHFPQSARLFVVRSAGRPLAAALTLTDSAALHVPWSGSDTRFRRLGANRLMYWRMLAWASDAGAPAFDFGRSSRDSGTMEFKSEWGAQPIDLYWHFILPPAGQMPELRPDSPKFRYMVACWKKLPLSLAKFGGPRIIRKLS